ncbi:hypothetical protein [Leuconostoc gasicomitatum]|uniref:hypothetical protein n=1 Tax=Leuconostoc gasicomitatum TaxID=115778 RepID=UPI001CC59A6F|nr:hypothetical protein [Leuconostoc gasicomitatum]MBZ5980371.1 hypothetical protein [Leuconostoc gasicomitatum]
MRYSDRVKIMTTVETNGPLGPVKKQVLSDWLPCRITGVNQYTNMNVFGKYDSTAVAIHFKNKVGKIDYVLIDGVQRKPQAIPNTRGNTVVIIQGV